MASLGAIRFVRRASLVALGEVASSGAITIGPIGTIGFVRCGVVGFGSEHGDGLSTEPLTSIDAMTSLGAIGFARREVIFFVWHAWLRSAREPGYVWRGDIIWRDQPHRHNRLYWRDQLPLARRDRLRSARRTPVPEDASCVRDGKHLNPRCQGTEGADLQDP